MKILDATCGGKTIWYQKKHPYVTFMDIREGVWDTRCGSGRSHGMVRVKPDVIADWTKVLPYPDEHFDMIVFDPPHILSTKTAKISDMKIRYGFLYTDTWKQVLSAGFKELFRVLKKDGFFVLKWCDCSRKVDEVLSLSPYRPLFGTQSGRDNTNHWIVFIKQRPEKPLLEG